LEFFKSWVTKEKDRPIYLWLYYCFPAERGHRGGWHVFPGFFAHGMDRWFKRFHRHGVRGAFFNGGGQDIEMYLTFKLLDDPTQDVDTLLDAYFDRYFGAAAGPLKAFYLEVEAAYCDPANYPQHEPGKPIGHQTEELAWRYLGTPARMTRLERLVTEARQAATPELEQRRVALFEREIWDYMRAGPIRTTNLKRPEYPDLPATLERWLFREPGMAADDAIQGKPFLLETAGSYYAWKGKTRPGASGSITGLTDGNVTESTFFFNPKQDEISARCELGPVPATGRVLRMIRVCWTMADSQRRRAQLKFGVRDATTGKWQDVTGFLGIDKWEGAKPDSYMVLNIPFPAGAVTNFDAIRLVDGAHRIGANPTRLTEIDVTTTPGNTVTK